MKSQYDLSPGTVLRLPIDVPDEYIGLFGKLPPRLISINSTNINGIYGNGDKILITLQFTSTVAVAGDPVLIVNTGCTQNSCIKKEIQSFICAADRGKFGLRFQDEFVMNIDVNTTQDLFKYRLEELNGINEVLFAI